MTQEHKLTKIEENEELKKILKKAEIKRVGENISKKELCDIFGFNYNFYMNCVSNRNLPSKSMSDTLNEYLSMPTADVYEMIFAFRSSDKNKGKTVKRREDGKEEFHELLNISDEEYNEYTTYLEKSGILKQPTLVYEQE